MLLFSVEYLWKKGTVAARMDQKLRERMDHRVGHPPHLPFRALNHYTILRKCIREHFNTYLHMMGTTFIYPSIVCASSYARVSSYRLRVFVVCRFSCCLCDKKDDVDITHRLFLCYSKIDRIALSRALSRSPRYSRNLHRTPGIHNQAPATALPSP